MNRALIFSHEEELKTTTLLINKIKTYCSMGFRRAVQNVLNLLEFFLSDSKGPGHHRDLCILI